MAKFKNLIVETGYFSFEGSTYDFAFEFETENKALISHLSARNDWAEIKDKKTVDSEIEELKKEAKELKIKFNKDASAEDLKKLIEEAKAL